MSIDHDTDIDWALKNLHNDVILQGNLNPQVLVRGGNDLYKHAIKIKNSVGNKQHIFNLGHGLLPETPIQNVHKFIEIIRSK